MLETGLKRWLRHGLPSSLPACRAGCARPSSTSRRAIARLARLHVVGTRVRPWADVRVVFGDIDRQTHLFPGIVVAHLGGQAGFFRCQGALVQRSLMCACSSVTSSHLGRSRPHRSAWNVEFSSDG